MNDLEAAALIARVAQLTAEIKAAPARLERLTTERATIVDRLIDGDVPVATVARVAQCSRAALTNHRDSPSRSEPDEAPTPRSPGPG